MSVVDEPSKHQLRSQVQAYYDRRTSYTCSGPGGAGAVLYAAVDLAKGY